MKTKYLTIAEAARALKITRAWAYQLVKRGIIPIRSFPHGQMLVKPADLDGLSWKGCRGGRQRRKCHD